MPKLDANQLFRMRDLRRDQTNAEQFLWSGLRRNTIKGAKFRRQHPIGPFILDFYCPAARLAIELDGGQHILPEKVRYDQWRTFFLQQQNIRVLRFWNNDVLKRRRDVLEYIWNELRVVELRTPLPSPLPEGADS